MIPVQVQLTYMDPQSTPLGLFLIESNRIEGITGPISPELFKAAGKFLLTAPISFVDVNELQSVIAPDQPLRSHHRMNVRVGNYIAPEGGPEIHNRLRNLIAHVHISSDPWKIHCAFEGLHPYMDGNGRTGRLLWVWHMMRLGLDPFQLPFLHTFYYQTLEHKGLANLELRD